MDIVIYMNEEDFKHKTGQPCKEDPEEGPITAFWEMKRIPKHFNENGGGVFLACKGFVRGVVSLDEFNEEVGGETLVWDSRNYVPLKVLIPCKPFRSFRYKWWN